MYPKSNTHMSKMKIKNGLLNHLIKNYNNSTEIKTLCDNLLREVQKECIENPTTYLTITSRQNRNGRYEYLTATTRYPISIDKVKDVRIYVGTIDRYPNGSKDVQGKIDGKRIMRKKLSEMFGV